MLVSFVFTDPQRPPLHMPPPTHNTSHGEVPCGWWGVMRRCNHAHHKKYSIISYIGRLTLDVQQSVPNIRQCTSNQHDALTRTYVLLCVGSHFVFAMLPLFIFLSNAICFRCHRLISIRSHCVGNHIHTSRRMYGTLVVVRGEAVRQSHTTWRKIYNFKHRAFGAWRATNM